MAELQEIASGLRFPEGPAWLEDGSVLLVEIEAGTRTKVAPDGSKRAGSGRLVAMPWRTPGPRLAF